jgi:hypothetical protein
VRRTLVTTRNGEHYIYIYIYWKYPLILTHLFLYFYM